MQRRLTPILQWKFLPNNYFAFLPGRNIHHSLVLLGEMLYQAASSGEEYILIVKAFDRLNWSYLMALLEKNSMIGTLTSFMKASFTEATLSVLLNRQLTNQIPLTRSVREGCSLSPLLFILAFDPLNSMLREAIIRRNIVEVQFPALNHLLQKYVSQ